MNAESRKRELVLEQNITHSKEKVEKYKKKLEARYQP